ncbi:MAG: hypothetical protein WA667_13100 [Candidatus Nitrosopolaris sp.]
MSNEIEIVKSPFVTRKKIVSHMNIPSMTISVKMPNGILITDPGQFDNQCDDIIDY